MKKNANTIILIILLLAVLMASPLLLPRLSVIPGPEGADMYFYGVQFGSDQTIFKRESLDPLPVPKDWKNVDQPESEYKWRTTQTHATTIEKTQKQYGEPTGGYYWQGPFWWYEYGKSILRTEHSRLAFPMTPSPLGYGSQTTDISFYTRKWTEGNIEYWEHIACSVIPIDITLEISIAASSSSGPFTWNDVKLWYVLDSINWLNAYVEDPNPPTNGTLSTYNYRGAYPLIAWVGGYTPWQWYDPDSRTWKEQVPTESAKFKTDLDPSYKGRIIDLYTTPGQKQDVIYASDVVNDEALMNTVARTVGKLPDPRFAYTAYMYLTLNSFGAYVNPESHYSSSYTEWYPVVHYRIRTLWAVYGEYVYSWTEEEADKYEYEFEERSSSKREVWVAPWEQIGRGIGAWFSNPFNSIMSLLLGSLIFILLLAIFAPGALALLIRLILGIIGRRKGG